MFVAECVVSTMASWQVEAAGAKLEVADRGVGVARMALGLFCQAGLRLCRSSTSCYDIRYRHCHCYSNAAVFWIHFAFLHHLHLPA